MTCKRNVLLACFSIAAAAAWTPAQAQSAAAYPSKPVRVLMPYAAGAPIDVIGRILGPLVALLTGITRAVTRPFGADPTRESQITAEELRLIVERGGQQGVLEAEEEQMINAVIELGERRLHEVMVPRIDIVALPVSATLEEAIDTIVEEGHSRVPVFQESIDEIVGILYAKDLLPYLKTSAEPRPAIRAILRTPVFAPESMSIDDLLHEFQRKKVHLAIVLDEYGGTAGLVSIEDLLEEIVGEIQDEYDTEEVVPIQKDDSQLRVEGSVPLSELESVLGHTFGREDVSTVGGLVLAEFGRVPKSGESFDLDGYHFVVDQITRRRVRRVSVQEVPAQTASTGEGAGEGEG